MDDLNKECMLHFIELKTEPDFVKTTFKGAKSIQAAKSVYERSSDPTIHEYLQVCIKIDQEHCVYSLISNICLRTCLKGVYENKYGSD